MSFALARNHYRRADTVAPDGPKEPYDVVFITLRELTRSLAVLAAAQEQARSFPSDHLNRSLTAIYILQSSLDFEQGGEVANDLFQLYEFARFHVLKALQADAEARLKEAASAISEILAAWEAIGAQVKAPGS